MVARPSWVTVTARSQTNNCDARNIISTSDVLSSRCEFMILRDLRGSRRPCNCTHCDRPEYDWCGNAENPMRTSSTILFGSDLRECTRWKHNKIWPGPPMTLRGHILANNLIFSSFHFWVLKFLEHCSPARNFNACMCCYAINAKRVTLLEEGQ